jgi:hypothetical protein
LIILIFLVFLGCEKKEVKIEEKKLYVKHFEQKDEEEIFINFCPICGIEVEGNLALRRPIAIMIENHSRSRPQSGLDKACVVYEAPCEGGITRFMALYLHNDTKVVGPIRSARPYFIDWCLEYDAVYVHCGQSWEAFERIYILNFPTINQMWRPKAFWRAKLRRAPHNLYTNTYKLRRIIDEKNWNKPLKITHFLFTENPIQKDIEKFIAKKIIIKYPERKYRVGYLYDEKRGKYLRFINRKPHKDAITGKQISVKNIIIQYVTTFIFDQEGRRELGLLGEGDAKIIYNGIGFDANWFKRSIYSPTSFFDKSDNVVQILPGNTWIQIVPYGAEVEIGG